MVNLDKDELYVFYIFMKKMLNVKLLIIYSIYEMSRQCKLTMLLIRRCSLTSVSMINMITSTNN